MQFTVKTDHSVWHDNPLTLRYSFSRDNADLPFPVRARNLPGFGISVLDEGHNLGGRPDASALDRGSFNELRVGVNALRRDNAAAERRHRRSSPPWASPARRSTAVDHGYPTLVRAGLRDARRRSEPARVAANPHVPRRRTR